MAYAFPPKRSPIGLAPPKKQLGFVTPKAPGIATPTKVGAPSVNVDNARFGVNPKPADAAGAGSDAIPDELEALHQDIMNSHKGSWAGIEQGVNANTALNQRRAAAMSAGMGRSVAGGFGGMMSQAMLGGQQNLINARLSHDQQGRQLQMDWLDKQMRRKEREEDRQWELDSYGGETPGSSGLFSTSRGVMGQGAVTYNINQMMKSGEAKTLEEARAKLGIE